MAVTVVTGLGRCGTTLLMHMLAAGGHPMHGKAPAYEEDEVALGRLGILPAALFTAIEGRAVKVIDPHRWLLPPDAALNVIWLDRDARQQARSSLKLLMWTAGFPAPSRHEVRAYEASLVRGRTNALNALTAAGHTPLLHLRFEDVIADPVDAACKLASVLGLRGADPRRMAAVVRLRSPDCAPDMAIELDLMREAEAASRREARA